MRLSLLSGLFVKISISSAALLLHYLLFYYLNMKDVVGMNFHSTIQYNYFVSRLLQIALRSCFCFSHGHLTDLTHAIYAKGSVDHLFGLDMYLNLITLPLEQLQTPSIASCISIKYTGVSIHAIIS